MDASGFILPTFPQKLQLIILRGIKLQGSILQQKSNILRDLSEISRGGGGVETEGGSQLFETAEKGGVMKNGPLKGGGSCKYMPMIM